MAREGVVLVIASAIPGTILAIVLMVILRWVFGASGDIPVFVSIGIASVLAPYLGRMTLRLFRPKGR